MRTRIVLFFVALLVVAACRDAEPAPGTVAASPSPSPQVAATVNGEPITLDELRADVGMAAAPPQVQQELEIDDSGQVRAELRARVLTQRIEDLVIEQGARDLDVEVTDADIADQRRRIVERTGGPTAFEARVSDAGFDEDAQRRLFRSLATAAGVEDALADEIPVEDEALRRFHDEQYGTVTVRHIVVETREEAGRLLEQLRDGADFARLAAEHSLDEDTRDDGGRLGRLDREAAGDQGGTFAEAVFDGGTGLLEPVRTFQGFHVIEVLDREAGPPLPEVRDEVRARVQQERVGPVYSDWVRTRIDAAEIEVDPSIGRWSPRLRRVEAVDVSSA